MKKNGDLYVAMVFDDNKDTVVVANYNNNTWKTTSNINLTDYDVVNKLQFTLDNDELPCLLIQAYSRKLYSHVVMLSRLENNNWINIFQKKGKKPLNSEFTINFLSENNKNFYFSTYSSNLQTQIWKTHVYIANRHGFKKISSRDGHIHK